MFNMYKTSQSFYDSLLNQGLAGKTLTEQQNIILNILNSWHCFPDTFNLAEFMQDEKRAEHIRYHIASIIMREIRRDIDLKASNSNDANIEACNQIINSYLDSLSHIFKDYNIRYSSGDSDNSPLNFRPRANLSC